MQYCQGTNCHAYRTKDRIRGTKGNKYYATRRRSNMYHGKGNFCSQNCMYDWLSDYIERALDHFGRITEPKKVKCNDAWYKTFTWGSHTNHSHYFANDLLGQRILITEQQYNDDKITNPKEL